MGTFLTIIITLAIICGIPFLVLNHYRKKQGVGWNDEPLFSEKQYADEAEKQADLQKSWRLAKRTVVLYRLFLISAAVLAIACIGMVGSGMADEFLKDNDLIFYYIGWLMPALILLSVFAIWYAAAGKRLEVKMILLGKDTSGFQTMENDAVTANLVNSVGRAAGHPEAAYGSAGLIRVLYRLALDYLEEEQQSIPGKAVTRAVLAVCLIALIGPFIMIWIK